MLRYIALLALAAGCSAPKIWTTQRFGPISVDGDISIDSGGSSGSTSTDQLKLEDDDGSYSPRVDLDFVGVHVNVNRFATQHRGRGGTANADLTFGTTTIPATTAVDTDLDLEMNTLALTFDFVPTSLVDVGLGLGGGVLEYDIEFQDLVTPANRIRSNESTPIGFVAGRVASELGDFRLSLDVAWIKVDIDDNELEFVDSDASVAWAFFDPAGPGFGELVLGYRLTQADVKIDDSGNEFDANLDFSGAYVGLSIGL